MIQLFFQGLLNSSLFHLTVCFPTSRALRFRFISSVWAISFQSNTVIQLNDYFLSTHEMQDMPPERVGMTPKDKTEKLKV